MTQNLNFIDLFAGCGGLSLGLMKAGFDGLFAVEKAEDAFKTLIHNLKDNEKYNFNWPEWLSCSHMTTEELLKNHKSDLKKLKGKIFLTAGGPPCQGFSFAGLRNPKDPRNRLTEEYIQIISLVKPKVLLLENVRGFQVAFKNKTKQPYSEKVTQKLEDLGYKVFKKVLPASMFGVPQPRARFIMIAFDEEHFSNKILNLENEDFFSIIEQRVFKFKEEKGLSNEIVSLGEAISDLEISDKELIKCEDSPGFKQIKYIEPKKKSPYLKLMRENINKNMMPNSLRLPNHKQETLEKFKYIIKNTPRGSAVSKEVKEKFKLKKQCLNVLCPNKLSTTITTLPDDTLHYKEPRILTVRENARLQSFPDWFEFQGKYTTGGPRRKMECPRYTQVGNAVPPLMAEALGLFIKELSERELVNNEKD